MLTAIVAMQKEADALLSQADSVRERSLFGKKIFEGTAFGQAFALVLSGVGKTNAAAAAMLAVSALGAKKLLNFGLAGGIGDAAPLFGVLHVVRAVQYDFDLSEVNGTPKGTLNEYGTPYFALTAGASAFPSATLATGDKLTSPLADLPLLHALGADVRDMEGAAIAHVAHFTGVPLTAYKAISNRVGGSATEEYAALKGRALDALAENMRTIFTEAANERI